MTRGDAGSVFIEALVATTIVAAVLGVTFESLAAADRRHRDIEQRREALMIARSELASVGAAVAVTPGDVEGVEGDFSWRIRIDAGPSETTVASRVGAPDLVTVSVRPLQGGPDMVVLRTLRLAASS
jgi:type II secretory pathway pseudopilin PulG